MNRFFSILLVAAPVFFLIVSLYIFEVYPFNPGGPLIGKQSEEVTLEIPDELKDLPEFNQEKVGRAKTYAETIKRAVTLEQKGYLQLALKEYETASQIDPKKIEPLLHSAKIYFTNQDFINAKINFEKVLALSPDNLDAQIGLGKTYIATRKPEEAANVFNQIMVHNQESKFYQAALSAYNQDHEKAKNLFNETISVDPDSIIGKNSQKFLDAFQEYASYQGGSPLHLKTLLSRAFIESKEYSLAITLLYEGMQEKKDYRDAWILLGYSYLNSEKYQDALESMLEARKLDSEKPETYFYLGLTYLSMQDYKSAADSLQLAKKYGYMPQSFIDQKLAEIYLEMKDYKEAAKSYESLLSLNDSDINYFIKPLWIYIDKLNEPEKALDLAKKAFVRHSETAMAYNLMGWAYVGAGQLMSAKTYLDKARELDPALDAIYLNFGKLYEKKGDFILAINYYKKAYQLGKGNSVALAAADLYNQLVSKQSIDPNSLKADILNHQ